MRNSSSMRRRREGDLSTPTSRSSGSTPPRRHVMEGHPSGSHESVSKRDGSNAALSKKNTSSFSTTETPPIHHGNASPNLSHSSSRASPSRPSRRNSPKRGSTNTANSTSQMPPLPPSRSRGSKKNPPTKPRDFQHKHDAMRVSIRRIDLNQRCAFEPTRLISVEEWQNHAQKAEETRKTGAMKKKMSPSLQHLQLLHRMQRVSTIRQLDFSPSVGLESDVFVPWDDDLQPPHQRVCRPSRRHNHHRDGRYRSIDPLKATMAVLPSHAPMLSNIKRRLPMRSDVGFPNASPEEIELKQKEINMETSWEEASPRLVVLVTSDFLGTAVYDEPTQPISEENLKYNGGGLVGMPLAGRELIMAKERNMRLFSSSKQHKRKKKWKPNRTSMLTPPIDASYSSTVGWRPRPFHDRPPGRENCLACPLRISFDIGNVEPLVCSLTLYSLPPWNQKNKEHPRGKMSENFWFPSGDWEGLELNLDAARALASGSTLGEVEDSWKHTKHKAIFSYDPLITGEKSNVYIVLQVHKVSQAGALSPYLVKKSVSSSPMQTPPRKKGLSGRIKSWKKMGKGGAEKEEPASPQMARHRSKAVYNMFGTQFLTPLCFGVSPLLPPTEKPNGIETQWPNGTTRNVQLYAFPGQPESQDEFVERLTAVAFVERQGALAALKMSGAVELPLTASSDSSINMSVYTDEEAASSLVHSIPPTVTSSASASASAGSSSSTRKRGTSASRIFKSPKRPNHRDESLIHSTPVAGTASLFTSVLGVDFVQSMLSTPHALRPLGHSRLPRVLVDVSGDCAIMMKPQHSVSMTATGIETTAPKKRSNLIRLPQSSEPSGYADASEIRDVLYLPPRADKHYGVDVPGSSRSLLNLLYLYPRFIRTSALEKDSKKSDKKSSRRNVKKHMENRHYSVRIRLVKTIVQVNGDTGEAETIHQELASFHNPAPWAGPTMLKALYTAVPDGFGDDTQRGVAMRDEIKLRLPMVLDGSYFLAFTLFAVELSDDVHDDYDEEADDEGCGLAIDVLGEAMIPLSNSSLREASSGVRVATVIPNGNHRVPLGDFQLQLETRLVSSIHVNDATVAAALRDFPYVGKQQYGNDDNYKTKELALVPSRSIVGKTPSSDPLVDIKVPFHTVFTSASESAIYSYFPFLMYMHLCNIVNRGAPELDLKRLPTLFQTNDSEYEQHELPCSEDTKFIQDNVLSLFEVIRKTKLKLKRCDSDRSVQYFLKSFVDSFDEDLLTAEDTPEQRGDMMGLQTLPMERSQSYGSLETPEKIHGRNNSDDTGDGEDEDARLAGAVLTNKPSSGHDADSRIFTTLSPVSASGVPFSRVAYGASKTDRMRIEAEIYQDGARHLFDDDETVVTFLTNKTIERGRPEQRSPYAVAENKNWDPTDNDSIVEQSPHSGVVGSRTSSGVVGEETRQKSSFITESEFATRVKTAAQVMISPCMAPTLSSVLASSAGSPVSNKTDGHLVDIKERASARLGSAVYGNHLPLSGNTDGAVVNNCIYTPGSDCSEDETDDRDFAVSSAWTTDGRRSKLRGSTETLLLSPSVISPQQTDSIPYVYESIMILWLRAWSEHAMASSEDKSMDGSLLSVLHSPEFDLLDPHPPPLFSFYAHMDVLLPLCLKSLVLRCDARDGEMTAAALRTLDSGHLQILAAFVVMLTRGLIGQALTADVSQSSSQHDKGLFRALSSSDLILDFLVGLTAVVHPEHVSQMISKYFETLRACEADACDDLDADRNREPSSHTVVWTEEKLRRAKYWRQLCLHSIERLSILPNFVALNYPLKYLDSNNRSTSQKTSWTIQAVDSQSELNKSSIDSTYIDGIKLLPHSGWLAYILVRETLLVCSLCCEALVAEAMSLKGQTKSSPAKPLRNPPGLSLERQDLLHFQSTAIQAITCTYELLLRRHAMDARFQTDGSRRRIAAVFAPLIMDKSLENVRLLSRMEATHKVRSLWLLCLIYVLQEAPDTLIRENFRSYCNAEDFLIHRFVLLLRLSSSTFQCFFDQAAHSSFPTILTESLSTWLLQESYNTICAATNMLIDECIDGLSTHPGEKKRMARGVLDLLLNIITIPQSSVTHFRALGGASHALNRFGVALFLEAAGGSLQHWVRVLLTLMNSVSLSVRSIATDFVVSLLGAVFSLHGNVDSIALVFLTLLPEVVAREIALFGVSGLLAGTDDVESSVWPLRRAVADIEEANPLDDDRVDPQLAPILALFCRACQAVIDGVLIELRLKGDKCFIVGSRVKMKPSEAYIFDADEESLFEAANFFRPETAPLQRLRWLLTLKSLHESKGQWVEAAETLMLCARTISDAIPHVRNVWRPSRFVLWYDERQSLWLLTIGKELGHPDRGNAQVMAFADSFLEPSNLFNSASNEVARGKLEQPTVPAMCKLLTSITKEAVSKYLLEYGMDELAHSRLESLLKVVMKVVDDHSNSLGRRVPCNIDSKDEGPNKVRQVEENAALRKLSAQLNAEMTRLADRMLLVVEDETDTSVRMENKPNGNLIKDARFQRPGRPHFVCVLVTGTKPARFIESTTIPTFLEWENPCICRIPAKVLASVTGGGAVDGNSLEEKICTEFGKPLRDALVKQCGNNSIVFRTGGRSVAHMGGEQDASAMILEVSVVHAKASMVREHHEILAKRNDGTLGDTKRFFYRKSSSTEHSPANEGLAASLVELAVAHFFPCALSRQRTLLTSEFVSDT